ncbi:MAG: hypothetical protein K6F32_06290 [Bacilli bacterium]|nr:hypothetical protein [Bacilli bacterium]
MRAKKDFTMDEEEIETVKTSRNALQSVAMSAIYDFLTYLSMKEPINVEEIVSGLCGLPYEECDYFVKATLIMSIKHYGEAVELFNKNMRKWTFNRLNRVEQAILLLSYSHFLYVDPEVEKGVVINVAVKLAKSYLSDNDYKFVNAILDKVLVRDAQ